MRKIKKVLLIDDDNITNYLNNSIISNLEMAEEVIMKMNGAEAINYLRKDCKATVNNFPNLILLDLKMPVMDGFEFLQEFEKLCNKDRHKIHVVILTTSRDAEDLIKLINLGNYYFVNKPLTTEKFLDIHHRYFREYE
ncbi:MAG: response regulator [Cytophagaceae bacterium]|nr:response regulator [Cytophagaceae bacterium]